MQYRADQGQRRQQGRRHHHIGKLTDGGVGQAPLEVVGAQRHHRGRDDGETSHHHQPVGGAGHTRCGEIVDAKYVDDHLHHAEHAGLDHRHRVQQGRHRRGRHHCGRQPPMKRHQRRLADAEHAQRQQPGQARLPEFAGQDTAGREVGGAGKKPDEHQRRQQEDDRGAHQQGEIHAATGARLVGAMVRDQRVGDERQQLVEHEQREQVAGKGDAHRGRKRQCKKDVKARLVRLVVAPHVADRVERIDDPQTRGDEREQHAQRLDPERDLQPRQHGEKLNRGPRATQHHRQQRQHARQQQRGRGECGGFAQVRQAPRQRDQRRARQRHHQRGENRLLGRQHQRSPPISSAAACAAEPTVKEVSSPKYTVAATSIAAGRPIDQGTTAEPAMSLRGSRK